MSNCSVRIVTGDEPVDNSFIEQWIDKVMDVLAPDMVCEFSLTFCDDSTIRQLNREWREIDSPTDILTFCLDDGEPFPPFPGEIRSLGDMVISLSSMRRNAEQFGESDKRELKRLLIHGLLHLLGEDHKTNNPDEPMLIRQEKLLVQLEEES